MNATLSLSSLSRLAICLFAIPSLVACGGADDTVSATESEESELASGGARFVEEGVWQLSQHSFVGESSTTNSTSEQGSTRVTFAFAGNLPTREQASTGDDGLIFVPVRVTFRAPTLLGGGKRTIEANAMCGSTLLTDRAGWQTGMRCSLTHEKDQRGASWIANVTYDNDGALTEIRVLAQHTPSFDQMVNFIRR